MPEKDEKNIEIDFIYTDTCPDCPPAKETVKRVTEDMDQVEVKYHLPKDVPEMVDEHDITHVPTIIINGEVAFVENIEDDELKDYIEKLIK